MEENQWQKWHIEKLDTNFSTIVKEMNREIVLNHLLFRNVIYKSEAAELKELLNSNSKSDQKSGEEKLLNLLKERGPHATNAFCVGLRKASQSNLAEMLNPSRPSSPTGPSGGVWESRARNASGNSVASKSSRKCSATSAPAPVRRSFSEGSRSIEPRGILEELIQSRETIVPDRPVPQTFDSTSVYSNFTRPKGLVLLISNEDFRGMKNRNGTKIDEQNLYRLFKNKLGYEVQSLNNLSARRMNKAMKDYAANPMHSYCDSAIVILLTHGRRDFLYGVKGFGDEISVERFVSHLQASTCPALSKKPKIFIIQACRGEESDRGYDLTPPQDGPSRRMITRGLREFLRSLFCGRSSESSTAPPSIHPTDEIAKEDEEDLSSLIKKLPNNADMLIAYSCAPGYVSYRNEDTGSWYIQALCEVIYEKAETEHLQDILTEVNRRVSETFESKSKDPDKSRRKQMPQFSSQLTKKFYFYPGLYKDIEQK